jgi:hypothetical protein
MSNKHELVNGTLTHAAGGGIVARCTCGWRSEHFSSMAASAAFRDHQSDAIRARAAEIARDYEP